MTKEYLTTLRWKYRNALNKEPATIFTDWINSRISDDRKALLRGYIFKQCKEQTDAQKLDSSINKTNLAEQLGIPIPTITKFHKVIVWSALNDYLKGDFEFD